LVNSSTLFSYHDEEKLPIYTLYKTDDSGRYIKMVVHRTM